MSKILKKPFILFWIIIPLIIILGHSKKDHTLDFNVHDTYYVVSQYHVSIIFSKFLGIIGLLYFILIRLKCNLSNTLNLIHWFCTFVGITFLLDVFSFFNLNFFIEERYYTNTNIPNVTIFYYLLLMLLGQVIFVINMVRGFLRRRKALH